MAVAQVTCVSRAEQSKILGYAEPSLSDASQTQFDPNIPLGGCGNSGHGVLCCHPSKMWAFVDGC